MAAVLNGKVDQILLTGGIAYSDYVTSEIKEKVGFIAPITVYPGEDELLAPRPRRSPCIKRRRKTSGILIFFKALKHAKRIYLIVEKGAVGK